MMIYDDAYSNFYTVIDVTYVQKVTLENIIHEEFDKNGFVTAEYLFKLINPIYRTDFDKLSTILISTPHEWRFSQEYIGLYNIKIPYYITEESYMKKNATPSISSIETYNDRVLLIRFNDGTFTKAVAMEDDPFDFDMLFTIAYLKRMLGKDGHKKYHKLIDKAHKVVKIQEEEKAKKEKEKEKRKAKIENVRNKKREMIIQAEERLGEIIFEAVKDAVDKSRESTHTKVMEDDLK